MTCCKLPSTPMVGWNGGIAVQTESGRRVDFRRDSRSGFRGHTRQSPCDDLHVAYFSGSHEQVLA